jgi:LETM1-like protein
MSSRQIKARINTKVIGGRLEEAAERGLLSRSEFQLLHRSMHDIKRVPIFGIILIIFGEFTPLVALLVSGAVPWTCRVPKHIHKDRVKLEKRREESFRKLTDPPPTVADASLESLSRKQLLHISKSLGLHSGFWPEIIGLPPKALLRWRIRKRVFYLELDDYLIGRDGGVRAMSLEEVRMALVERGVDILGKTEHLRSLLRSWLRARSTTPVTTLCLTRYAFSY